MNGSTRIVSFEDELNETPSENSAAKIHTASVTINGDLVTTNLVAADNKTLTDTLIKLGQGLTEAPSKDQGIVFTRGNGSATNIANKAMIWDESTDSFAFISANTESGTTAGNVMA